MFGFGGVSRRRGVVAELAGSLPGGVQAMHAVEKATVLVLANSMLKAAERSVGVPLADDPTVAGAGVADRSLRDLIAHRDQLRAIVDDEKSPNRRHAACHLRAAELACLTLGVAVDPAAKRGCIAAWRAAWEGRGRLREAVVWIRRYEGSTGVSAVPIGEGANGPSDMDLLTTGQRIPAFLRVRRA